SRSVCVNCLRGNSCLVLVLLTHGWYVLTSRHANTLFALAACLPEANCFLFKLFSFLFKLLELDLLRSACDYVIWCGCQLWHAFSWQTWRVCFRVLNVSIGLLLAASLCTLYVFVTSASSFAFLLFMNATHVNRGALLVIPRR